MPSWAMGSLFSRWWSDGERVENLSYDGVMAYGLIPCARMASGVVAGLLDLEWLRG
jgi:hypothetical protein